jgi:hypothetical protein
MLDRVLPSGGALAGCRRAGERSCLADSTTGPMAKLPCGGSVMADRDTVCFMASNFRVQPDQRREEIPLFSVHLVAP